MAKKATQKQIVYGAAERHGVPGWLLWGIYGAESTWGTNGTNYFGLIEGSYSGRTVRSTTNLAEDADIAAELLARLKREHGSWAGAVSAYSGGEYSISHPKELSRGGGQQASQLVDYNPLEFGQGLLEKLPIPGLGFGAGNALEQGGGQFAEGLENTGIPGIQQLGEIGKFLSELSKLVFTPEGWLQIGQVTGGIILIGWGVHHLISVSTGVSPTHVVKGTGTKIAEGVAAAAALK